MQNLIPLPRSLPMSVNAIDARERARLTFHVDVVMLCECVIGDVRGRAPEDVKASYARCRGINRSGVDRERLLRIP